MPDVVTEALRWIVPALVVFGVTAIAVAVIAWGIRHSRRSPKALASALALRDHAGAALVRLDDEVAELDLEVGLSGALYAGRGPASLHRARLTAQHARDAAFDEYRVLGAAGVSSVDIRRGSERIERRVREALATTARARADHADWMQANVSAAEQVTSAQARLAALRSGMGAPQRLVADLSSRFADEEWRPAANSARSALAEADEADRLLARAAAAAADPSESALEDLARAERALRAAEADARTLEETHRLVTQAAQAVAGEFEAARTALRQALVTQEHLDPAPAQRLGEEIRAIGSALDDLEADAARRPTRTVDRIARLRDRLDLALGDARTALQRIRGARTALPGTLAAARGAIAEAEASALHSPASAPARLRLLSAQRELADARRASDPVEALDAARRAMRDAEDAKALTDFARETTSPA